MKNIYLHFSCVSRPKAFSKTYIFHVFFCPISKQKLTPKFTFFMCFSSYLFKKKLTFFQTKAFLKAYLFHVFLSSIQIPNNTFLLSFTFFYYLVYHVSLFYHVFLILYFKASFMFCFFIMFS
jgi:hypothetical protein